ncbi:MAG: LLM class flavin-dependent oxidoreductase [Streptosporangiales bacterium]|nr:LLM class flavin-dependent oxidoreductase [Streptosporangiales bacterium]
MARSLHTLAIRPVVPGGSDLACSSVCHRPGGSTMRPSIGLLADVGVGAAQLVQIAREAELAGFEGVRTIEYEYDSFAYAQAIATATSRVVTGSSVARYFARHPLLTAETAAVIDLFAPGRFVIGLGSGPAKRADPGLPQQRWGLPTGREVARIREYIEVVRLALTEDVVNYEGEFYGLTDVRMRVKPASPHVPIWLAAGGEQMTRLAGRAADGVFVQFAGRVDTERTLDIARDAARKAGRDPDDVRLGNLIMTCVGDDSEAARRAARAHLVDWYLHQPRIQRVFAEAGYEEMAEEIRRCNPPHDTRGTVDEILAHPQARRAAEAIPDGVLEEFTIVGTPEECRRKLDEFVGWGTDVPILYAYPAGADWTEGYRAVIRAFADDEPALTGGAQERRGGDR